MSEIIKYAKLYKRIRQKYATDIKQTNHINSMNYEILARTSCHHRQYSNKLVMKPPT